MIAMAAAAAGFDKEIKDILEGSTIRENFEPLYHAVRRRSGEELEPMPAEIMEAIEEVEKQIEEAKAKMFDSSE